MGRSSTHLSLSSDLLLQRDVNLNCQCVRWRKHDRNQRRIGSNGWWKPSTLSKKCNKFLSEKCRIPCAHETARNEFYSNDLPNRLRNWQQQSNAASTAFRMYAFQVVFHLINISNITVRRAEAVLAHTSSDTQTHSCIGFSAPPRIPFDVISKCSLLRVSICVLWRVNIFDLHMSYSWAHLSLINNWDSI